MKVSTERLIALRSNKCAYILTTQHFRSKELGQNLNELKTEIVAIVYICYGVMF